MYFALENIENQAFSQKHLGKKLKFQVNPGSISRSDKEPICVFKVRVKYLYPKSVTKTKQGTSEKAWPCCH
jgi:hypothetical protein